MKSFGLNSGCAESSGNKKNSNVSKLKANIKGRLFYIALESKFKVIEHSLIYLVMTSEIERFKLPLNRHRK